MQYYFIYQILTNGKVLYLVKMMRTKSQHLIEFIIEGLGKLIDNWNVLGEEFCKEQIHELIKMLNYYIDSMEEE